MLMSRTLRSMLFGCLVALVAVPSAHALQVLSIQETDGETAGPLILIVDNFSTQDTNPTAGVIAVDPAALNLLLNLFDVTALGSTSNALSGTAFSNDTASLSLSGDVVRVGRNGAATLTVSVTDGDYFFPASNPKFMGSAATDQFTFTETDDGRSFQSFFDPGNSSFAKTLGSPLMTFNPPAGPGPFNTSGTAPVTLLGTQPIPFSLTNETILTLSKNGDQSGADQFTGTTTVEVEVSAVPEPSAALLLTAGLSMLVAGGLRRRR